MRRWLLIPPVASLFAVSFYESWWALNKAATAAELPDPRPWPWSVDGFILVMALMVVFAAIDGHSWGTWWPRLGLLSATALSTGIQAAWAPEADWAWALHAWSPLAVLSSFECLVWLVFGQDQAGSAPVDVLVPGSRERQPVAPVRTSAADQRTRTRPGGLTLAQRRRVEGWVAEGRTNKSQMARELGLSDRAKKERLAPLVDQLAAQQNGDRP